MAATDKNMTFDVNLLPATTGDHNLGSSNLKWKINGVADPKLTDTTALASMTGTLAVEHGGTNITYYTKGDILYASNNSTLSKLGIGTAGYFLKATANGPAWANTTDITTIGTITTGTWNGTVIGTAYGGTGATTPEGARTNLGVKALQNNVSSPTASGNSISYIDTISQNTQGVISATKKTVPNATTSENGLMLSSDKEKLDDIDLIKQVKTVSIEPVQDLHGYESPWIGTDTDKQPYLFRKISDSSVQDKGTHEMDKLVGGTVAWNQLYNKPNGTVITYGITFTISNGRISVSGVNNGSGVSYCTFNFINPLPANHVILFGGIPGTGSAATYDITLTNTAGNAPAYTGWKIAKKSGEYQMLNIDVRLNYDADTKPLVFVPQVFDLTQMFGSTIADYIYSLEQTTAGAGVAWFRRLFPASYYPYNAGQLMSVKTSAHVTRGFNQWDEEIEAGAYSLASTGEKNPSSGYYRNKNFIKVLPGTTYYVYDSPIKDKRIGFYDASKNYLSSFVVLTAQVKTFTTPSNCEYVNFDVVTTVEPTICINISDPSKNGTYEPYDGHTYSLDSDLELRGIPKLDSNNNLYYDGDVYEASGNVQRKYGIVDLGTLTWRINSHQNDAFQAEQFPSKIVTTGMMANVICPAYKTIATCTVTSMSDKSVMMANNTSWLIVRDSAYTDAATFKTAMSGVMLVYELATPTTETADPFTSTQVINLDGTEEYIDTRTVSIPVGHESNYANICPIEGWTGAIVTRCGKNLFDISNFWQNGQDYSFNGEGNKFISIDVLPGTYTVSTNVINNTNPSIASVFASSGSRHVDGPSSGTYGVFMNTPRTVNVSEDEKLWIYIRTLSNSYLTWNEASFAPYYVQVEVGSAASAYESYNTGSVIYPISWQSSAGTVYGGTLDVTTGLLTSKLVSTTFGALTGGEWIYQENYGRFYYSNPLGKYSGYINSSIIGSRLGYNNSGLFLDTLGRVFAITDIASSVDDFLEIAADKQLVYELATPQTYQLTPTQILLLAEHKHVWADCGEITLQSCFTNNAANVTGIVAIEHGGTGSATAGVNTVFAGPSSGTTNAAPNFRSLVSADIPTLSIIDKTSGTLTVPRGGTGATTVEGARTNLGLGTMATESAANYLKLSGGTMTGALVAKKITIVHASGGEQEYRVTYGSTVDMSFMIGNGDRNHGIFDSKASKWMIYADINGNVTVNGNATTATTASKLSNTSAIGSTTRPVYFTNGGIPSQTTYCMSGTNTTATTAIAITTDLPTGNWYVNGTYGIYNQSDGVVYAEQYSSSWIHEIYGDYRTGQIAVRGKNNGTWQDWRKILDSVNYKNYLNDGITSDSTDLAATANSALIAAKKTASSNNALRLYLTGARVQDSTGVDSYSYQYTYTENGLLSALKVGLNLDGTEKAHMEWNNTDQTIDFVFA